MTSTVTEIFSDADILEVLKRYWGYDGFRSLQLEIIRSILHGRDVLAIMPTGGGKSICFQIPALLREGLTLVVSPLISLMKDQVDALREMGVAAAYLNSSLTTEEHREVSAQLRSQKIKLLYLSPERLALEGTQKYLQQLGVVSVVIDEAHCISHWGHDFRPDYRALGKLRQMFPQASIAAFTATATPEVQNDIVRELNLAQPQQFVANVDRGNLTYRIFRREAQKKQIPQILERHKNEPGIIYCLSRSDVDELSEFLNAQGFANLPYHAGLTDETRRRHQQRFASEEIDIMVATVAFGMGIDRSNLRFVIHASMPQSLEHYQQEVGRAGRDGLPAFGYLFFSAGDYRTRLNFTQDSAQADVMRQKLNQIYDFCQRPQCRHKKLVEYFGQTYAAENCQGCDFCLQEVTLVEDSLIVAQKILSCVLRVKERFGADHVARVLKGEKNERVLSRQHEQLSTFGLLQDKTLGYIRFMIDQLVGQGMAERVGEFDTLSVTAAGRQVLRGEVIPRLAAPLEALARQKAERKTREKKQQDWVGIDTGLFQRLRQIRAELAKEKAVPAFIIFGDKTLKDMAARRPQTVVQFAEVFGVGEQKLKLYADIFLKAIAEHSSA